MYQRNLAYCEQEVETYGCAVNRARASNTFVNIPFRSTHYECTCIFLRSPKQRHGAEKGEREEHDEPFLDCVIVVTIRHLP